MAETIVRPGASVVGLVKSIAMFGAVGAIGFVVDVTAFNVLRATVLNPEAIAYGALWAKVISTSLAIVTNWLGNRYWTFGANRSERSVREFVEFTAVSLIGMTIGVACLWVSHYVLGLTSAFADNVSGNVIGLALGSIFRYLAYRFWVFAPERNVP